MFSDFQIIPQIWIMTVNVKRDHQIWIMTVNVKRDHQIWIMTVNVKRDHQICIMTVNVKRDHKSIFCYTIRSSKCENGNFTRRAIIRPHSKL